MLNSSSKECGETFNQKKKKLIDGEVRSEEGQEPVGEHGTKLIKTRPQDRVRW